MGALLSAAMRTRDGDLIKLATKFEESHARLLALLVEADEESDESDWSDDARRRRRNWRLAIALATNLGA